MEGGEGAYNSILKTFYWKENPNILSRINEGHVSESNIQSDSNCCLETLNLSEITPFSHCRPWPFLLFIAY